MPHIRRMGNGVSYILQVIQAEKVYIQAEAEGVVFKSNFFFLHLENKQCSSETEAPNEC